ncbi:YezD family protein [Paraliobacillus salinarum]|uniref:YezD family protein n=1 Tax=Paraliobacillus salinarum TaxID=1158996 RepID=UPI0015F4A5AE|nr:YezD family protein [Paraliobacillus salinarum]
MSKLDQEKLDYLTQTLQKIDFGSIVLTVHDGSITQIDSTEKRRFPKQTEHVSKRERKLQTK